MHARFHASLACLLVAWTHPARASDPTDPVPHRGPIVALAVHGESVFAVSQGGLWRHMPAAHERLAQVPFRVTDFIADGKTFHLVGGIPGEAGNVAHYDERGNLLAQRSLGFDLVTSIVRTPEGLVVGDSEGRLHWLDPISLETQRELDAHTQSVRALARSPDQQTFASSALDGLLKIVRVSGEVLTTYTDHTAGIECVAFSPDGAWIASGARDGKVRVHASGDRLRRTWSDLRAPVTAIAFLTNDRLACGLADGRVFEASVASGTLSELGRFGPVHSLARASNGDLVVGSDAVRRLPSTLPSHAARGVVLIVVDDLGWKDLGCAGSDFYETPAIDRLATQGVFVETAYAACAVCSPTRAALQTGRSPTRLAVTDWIHHRSPETREALAAGQHIEGFDLGERGPWRTPRNRPWLPRSEITLAELAKSRGYRTAHVGKWHLGPAGYLPEDQGYDVNRGGFELGSPPAWFDPYSNREHDGIHGLPPRREGEYLTDREADEACAFLRSCGDAPFLLHYAPYAVHAPLQAVADDVAHFETKPQGTVHWHPTYAAMVKRVDDAVGRILATLDELGRAADTLVIFTSDNGGAVHFPATNSAPLRRGKGYPYEGGLRVPLVARWPGVIPEGTRSTALTTSVDLYPTIANATGTALPIDRPLDGMDRLPTWRALDPQEGATTRTLTWHFPHYWWGTRIEPYSIIRRGDWKLIRHVTRETFELFDLANDAGETRDLASARPTLVRELAATLNQRLVEQGARYARRR
ncbi:MAG: sulfatase-like hydrolase/transferase [Planctomycetes bacterium]|nr:sulfatase-like hydrolase/transferase [Planctomycetota bacterium]